MQGMLEAKLEWLEETPDILVHGRDETIVPLLSELLELSPEKLLGPLMERSRKYPGGFAILLDHVSEHEVIAVHVARAMMIDLAFWTDSEEYEDALDAIFVIAYPFLEGSLQKEWIAERPGVAAALGLREGVDYVRTVLTRQEALSRYPMGTPLPSLQTVEGVQARLITQRFNPGPFTSSWNDQTARALLRYQHDQYHSDPKGELDEEALASLSRIEW